MTEKINIRSTFLPDEGEVFVRVDMSQIEHRMCMMYCGTARTVEIANRHPNDYDAHTDNARLIFNKQEINKQERYLGKKTVHGAERQMGGYRMSESISKDTNGELFVHPKQCDNLLRAFYAAFPEIESIYFPWVEQQIKESGMLYDSWGGRIDLRNRRVDHDLLKEGYSWFLQVEAARWTNQYLFIPTSYYMQQRYRKPCSAQVHDEVIVSVPLKDAYHTALVMVAMAQQRRTIRGHVLCVPAGVTVGRSYGDEKGVEFKLLPGKEEFYRQLKEKGGFE